jgi:CRISPR-associated protein Cas1
MTADINQTIQDISWGRLDVSLINCRNKYARESPSAIFQSLFKRAAITAGLESEHPLFVFHSRTGYLEDRIIKGTDYDLTIIFPSLNADAIGHFASCLTHHLENPNNNFKIISLSNPEVHTVAMYVHEALPQYHDGDDIWLDFTGRLAVPRHGGDNNWRIDTTEFFNLIVTRLKKLYSIDISAFNHLWQNIVIRSHYWEYAQTKHSSKSTPGKMLIQGREGPICLQGISADILPLLYMCSNLHIGSDTTYGRGHYRIVRDVNYLDRRIISQKEIRQTIAQIDANSDLGDDLDCESYTRDEYVQELSSGLRESTWQFGNARQHKLPKKAGGMRSISTFPVKDQILHRHLHRLLQPPFDRMFEECSVGFRPKRSVNTARMLINAAIEDGYSFVVESDIDSFFDEISWETMDAKLDSALPPGEPLVRQLLRQIIRTGTTQDSGSQPREKGLLQGSPLSPMLSNLYLDVFDEKMLAAGYRLIRYADDFVILARTREEAEQALADAERYLAEDSLHLKEEKTFIRSVDIGFVFLGMSFGSGEEEDFVEKLMLRKPLYIRPLYSNIGLDYDSIAIKKNRELVQRVPLHRVREIVIFGTHSISTRLLQQCSFEKIPVTFCSPSGGYMNTLAPDSRRFHDIEAKHSQHYYGLSDDERLGIACNIVETKIHNYRDWVRTRFGPDGVEALAVMETQYLSLPGAATIDALRGHEGIAARAVFGLLARLAAERGFVSSARVPYKKKDELNSLLDFAYFMLTARINILLRSRGLNPYLGFLHSSKDHYESLVYDLAEPFRFRMDALVLRMISQRIIKIEDFKKNPDKGARYYLTPTATGTFIDAFERALLSVREKGGNSLINLLEAQVYQLTQWIEGSSEYLRLYRR